MGADKARERALSVLRQMEASFADRAQWQAGWLHDFVCSGCSRQLSFVPDARQYGRDRFVCGHCGRTFSGEPYRGAWVYLYRRWYAERLQATALCRDDPQAVAFLKRYLSFYAAHYGDFPVHGAHAGEGRIMGQSLDEAVFGIRLLKAVDACRDCFDAEELSALRNGLFVPMARLLWPQAQRVHNISVWIACCVGMTGLVFGLGDLLQEAVDGEYGLTRQTGEGLTRDFLWREGSLHYHYYALEALTAFGSLLKKHAPGHPLLTTLKEMYLAPLRLSPDGWSLPSLNDGWYPLTFGSYGAQIVQAARLTGDGALLRLAEEILRRLPELREEPAVWLAGLEPVPAGLPAAGRPESVQCFDGSVAVLRQPFAMTLKSTSLVPTHAHRDSLSVTIGGLSGDLGTPGYGSPITKTWYRGPLAHNGISIDGNLKVDFPPRPVRLTQSGAEAVLEGTLAGESIRASRTLCREGRAIRDRTLVQTERPHVIDWTLHATGEWRCRGVRKPAGLGTRGAWALFEAVSEVGCTGAFEARTTGEDGCEWVVRLRVPPGMRVFLARTPSNPSSEQRHTILCRTEGTQAAFEAVIERKAGGIARFSRWFRGKG